VLKIWEFIYGSITEISLNFVFWKQNLVWQGAFWNTTNMPSFRGSRSRSRSSLHWGVQGRGLWSYIALKDQGNPTKLSENCGCKIGNTPHLHKTKMLQEKMRYTCLQIVKMFLTFENHSDAFEFEIRDKNRNIVRIDNPSCSAFSAWTFTAQTLRMAQLSAILWPQVNIEL